MMQTVFSYNVKDIHKYKFYQLQIAYSFFQSVLETFKTKRCFVDAFYFNFDIPKKCVEFSFLDVENKTDALIRFMQILAASLLLVFANSAAVNIFPNGTTFEKNKNLIEIVYYREGKTNSERSEQLVVFPFNGFSPSNNSLEKKRQTIILKIDEINVKGKLTI